MNTTAPTTSQIATAASLLARLPEQHDPGFATGARQILAALLDAEEVLRAVLDDVSQPREVRFGALYTLLVRLNREERSRDYADLVRAHEPEFGGEPYFNTFRALVARGRGVGGLRPESLRAAADYARRAAAHLPGVIGVQHQIATFLTDYLELVGTDSSPVLLDEAERAIDAVLAQPDGYRSHYLETRARLYVLRGNYGAARAAIADAIEVEPADTPDLARRIARYQATRVRIDLLEERDRLAARQEEFRGELDRFRTQQLELLGLLAAVVAFVASAASIAAQSAKAADGARLMTAMAGAVILVFTSFAYTNTRAPWTRLAPPALLGAALLLIATLLGR
ncbi:hypothetical protein KGA66_12935 [Actinocrinis puniceicyclus]|uniref:Tetratricopeptide repeat protein n=1 Tax=Actinocrinis puniceicyclus TaxID=977794 RepID=A0A8J8BEP2_9ACTN|nr:hypothetical protein [Actinocrinis puniceicyclus]MBS2963954.1 hypothetical protein [Actinocrinis puniceicyclus]